MPSSRELQKQVIQDVQNVFVGTLEGQRLWKHLEGICFENRSGFDKDPYVTAFNAGVRSVLLHLKTLKNIDPVEYEKKLKEQETQENG